MSVTINYHGKSYKGVLGAIHMSLAQLRTYVKAGLNNEDLLWEIRLYEFILLSDEPEVQARAYFNARHPADFGREPPLEKREVVRILGWDVP